MNKPVDEFEFFLEKPWSDGFPVVTPTEARVKWMLQGTRRDPDALVAHVAGLWSARGDRYSELRGRPEVRDRRRVEMYLIGG